MKSFTPIDFIRESNRIENIHRDPTEAEIGEYHRFMALDEVTVAEMQKFVQVCQKDAELRERRGMNVMIGNYFPPAGDITIRTRLMDILAEALRTRSLFEGRDIWPHAYEIHRRYQALHPFMDGNGRSGRMLWMWMMREARLGFLHTWYYQSLSNARL